LIVLPELESFRDFSKSAADHGLDIKLAPRAVIRIFA
jgi:hypothetical protein